MKKYQSIYETQARAISKYRWVAYLAVTLLLITKIQLKHNDNAEMFKAKQTEAVKNFYEDDIRKTISRSEIK